MDDLYSLTSEEHSKAMLQRLEATCDELTYYFGNRWWGINPSPFKRLREEYEQMQELRYGIWLGRQKVKFFSHE